MDNGRTVVSELTLVDPLQLSSTNSQVGVGSATSMMNDTRIIPDMTLQHWTEASSEYNHYDPQDSPSYAWEDSMMISDPVDVNPVDGIGSSDQSLAVLKPMSNMTLPPFVNYTANLSINGMSGTSYHAISNSQVSQQSTVSPSSNPDIYQAPIVSSSTPCSQNNQNKQQQQQQPQQQHQQQHHHHHHHQQQQQQINMSQCASPDYDIDPSSLTVMLGSTIVDTTVPNDVAITSSPPNNGLSSSNESEWIDTMILNHTPMNITNSCRQYASVYNTGTVSPQSQHQQQQQLQMQLQIQQQQQQQQQQHQQQQQQQQQQQRVIHLSPVHQQHVSPALETLLNSYQQPSMLQQRLQANLGEAPSSTSTYSPVSPPGRVSTSSIENPMAFVPPQQQGRKRRRSGSSAGSNAKKANNGGAAGQSCARRVGTALSNKDQKPSHKCGVCNRGFLNKSNIKVHLRTHTGEKPFPCDTCLKPFRQKAHLIKHMQIHRRRE